MALHYIQAMAGFARGSGVEWHLGLFLNPKVAIVLVVAVIGSTPILPWFKEMRERLLAPRWFGPVALDDGVEAMVSLVVMPAVFILCAMSLASGTHNPFIYFQF